MNDPRCWREVLIRGGMTVILVAVAAIFLGVDPWVWVIPPAIAAITVLKWAVRPSDEEDADGTEEIDSLL